MSIQIQIDDSVRFPVKGKLFDAERAVLLEGSTVRQAREQREVFVVCALGQIRKTHRVEIAIRDIVIPFV